MSLLGWIMGDNLATQEHYVQGLIPATIGTGVGTLAFFSNHALPKQFYGGRGTPYARSLDVVQPPQVWAQSNLAPESLRGNGAYFADMLKAQPLFVPPPPQPHGANF